MRTVTTHRKGAAAQKLLRLFAFPDGAHLIAMIHDELLIECLESQAKEVKALTVEMMGRTQEGFRVPIKDRRAYRE